MKPTRKNLARPVHQDEPCGGGVAPEHGTAQRGVDPVTLTPDKEPEVHHAPAPHTMRGGLFLGDRMFFIKAYLAEVIVQAKGILTPPYPPCLSP